MTEAEQGGIPFEYVLTAFITGMGVLATVIKVLYSKSEKAAERVNQELKESREKAQEQGANILALTKEVGILTGKTDAYVEVNESISEIKTGIESLSGDVLEALNNDSSSNS